MGLTPGPYEFYINKFRDGMLITCLLETHTCMILYTIFISRDMFQQANDNSKKRKKRRGKKEKKKMITSMPARIADGTSTKSFKFLSGKITLFMPYRCAART